jgi:hypothetical protein
VQDFFEIGIGVGDLGIFEAVLIGELIWVEAALIFFFIGILTRVAFVVEGEFREPFVDFVLVFWVGNYTGVAPAVEGGLVVSLGCADIDLSEESYSTVSSIISPIRLGEFLSIVVLI